LLTLAALSRVGHRATTTRRATVPTTGTVAAPRACVPRAVVVSQAKWAAGPLCQDLWAKFGPWPDKPFSLFQFYQIIFKNSVKLSKFVEMLEKYKIDFV
jgi:hypothetical protein